MTKTQVVIVEEESLEELKDTVPCECTSMIGLHMAVNNTLNLPTAKPARSTSRDTAADLPFCQSVCRQNCLWVKLILKY